MILISTYEIEKMLKLQRHFFRGAFGLELDGEFFWAKKLPGRQFPREEELFQYSFVGFQEALKELYPRLNQRLEREYNKGYSHLRFLQRIYGGEISFCLINYDLDLVFFPNIEEAILEAAASFQGIGHFDREREKEIVEVALCLTDGEDLLDCYREDGRVSSHYWPIRTYVKE